MISIYFNINYSVIYTSSHTLYTSRGSRCAPARYHLHGLVNIYGVSGATEITGQGAAMPCQSCHWVVSRLQ